MDYSKRTSEWLVAFFEHIKENHADLEKDYLYRIIFSPAVDNKNIIHAGYFPNFDLSKEYNLKLFNLFEEYYELHRNV